MPIADESGNTTQQNQQSTMSSAFQNAQVRQDVNRQQNRQGEKVTLGHISRAVRGAFSRTVQSEALAKLYKKMQEIVQETKDIEFETTLIPIEKESTPSLAISLLLIAVRLKDGSQPMSFHTLMLDATAKDPDPITNFVSPTGKTVELVRTLSDAIGDRTMQIIKAELNKRFPEEFKNNRSPRMVGYCRVGRELDLDHKDTVNNILVNGYRACVTDIVRNEPGFKDLNLSEIGIEPNLAIYPSFQQPSEQDIVGNINRTDILLEFKLSTPPNQNQNQLELSDTRNEPIARVGGFIDLVYDPANSQQSYFNVPNQNHSPITYTPRFVATTMETSGLQTIGSQLLSVIAMSSLTQNNAWMGNFMRRDYSNADVDFKDIGAIGYEVDYGPNAKPEVVGKRINTKSDSFRDSDLGALLGSFFHPNLMLSLDVNVAGPESWCNDPFAACGMGIKEANDEIIRAANELTNGAFGQHFRGNWAILQNEDNQIHTGYYITSSGEKRDIRDVDYLYVLNAAGGKDKNVQIRWSDSYTALNRPLVERLEERKGIIFNALNNPVITGKAVRVTFDPAFINALLKAVADMKLGLNLITNISNLGGFERGRARYHEYGQIESSNVFHRGSSFNQNTTRSGFNNGWSRYQR